MDKYPHESTNDDSTMENLYSMQEKLKTEHNDPKSSIDESEERKLPA